MHRTKQKYVPGVWLRSSDFEFYIRPLKGAIVPGELLHLAKRAVTVFENQKAFGELHWDLDKRSMSISDLVRIFRIRRSMTQAELASLCGIHQGEVSRIESGKCLPRPSTARKLAKILGCDYSRLLAKKANRRGPDIGPGK